MNHTTTTYLIYLTIAIPVTIWVARALHKNGRVFLLSCFKGNEELADSINHLLLVGFYLVNIGFVVLFLKIDQRVENTTDIIEALSAKIGVVLLVLGGMHFFNMLIFTKLRDKTANTPPNLPPTNQPKWREELTK
ncbi:hypothetical protein [Luteolibacter sp. AS25]|uniref:hypothetical protein n=1 Tax=Luteolibacter sp. AS25 TaxID=3135776 RepID=UPI00398B362F